MRIAICDDDPLFTAQLLSYLKDFFKLKGLKCPEISTFNSGESLLKDSREKDIVFLDIEMPGLSGIATGTELKSQNKNTIIFVVTAYTEYLDDAMRFHVFRYLSKPLEKQRLFRNMKDALYVYCISSDKIAIETKQGTFTVPASDIIMIESLNKKTFVRTLERDYESVSSITEWAQRLPENCFFQSHRSFIVNFEHVSDFDHTLIHLCSRQYSAYLTRRKYTSFKTAYLLYLESVR